MNELAEGEQFRGQHGHKMTPLNYFLWGSMKSMVYGTPGTSDEDLIARVHGAIENLTRQPHLFGHACEANNIKGAKGTSLQ